jgi:ankyrin repeat protein
MLIENGAAIDSITPNGSSALWQAANDGYVQDVEFLLNHGADPSSCGKNGKSAIATVPTEYGKCRFLLETVRDRGKEQLKSSNLWDAYESEIFERWFDCF